MRHYMPHLRLKMILITCTIAARVFTYICAAIPNSEVHDHIT